MNRYTESELYAHRALTIDAMLELGPEHFNMSWWFHTADGPVSAYVVDLKSCGTTACLAGTAAWAARRAGLYHFDIRSQVGVMGVAEWLGLPSRYFYSMSTDNDQKGEHSMILDLLRRANNGEDVASDEAFSAFDARMDKLR